VYYRRGIFWYVINLRMIRKKRKKDIVRSVDAN
jgi:hypothetical protein